SQLAPLRLPHKAKPDSLNTPVRQELYSGVRTAREKSRSNPLRGGYPASLSRPRPPAEHCRFEECSDPWESILSLRGTVHREAVCPTRILVFHTAVDARSSAAADLPIRARYAVPAIRRAKAPQR